MTQRRFLQLSEILRYYPQEERRNSCIQTNTASYPVDSALLGEGVYGKVHLISGTPFLRKKGPLRTISYLERILNDYHFHRLFYGKNSAMVKFFIGNTEISHQLAKQKLIRKNRHVTYRLIKTFIPGMTLTEALRLNRSDPAITLLLYLRTAETLKRLHQKKIFHGDIKSGNLIVDDKFNVYPIDFDFAYEATDKAITTTRDCVYWPPERKNKLVAGLRANASQDIYSMGYMFFRHHKIPDDLVKISGFLNIFQRLIDFHPSNRLDLDTFINRIQACHKLYSNPAKHSDKNINIIIPPLVIDNSSNKFKRYAPPTLCAMVSSVGLFSKLTATASATNAITGTVTAIIMNIHPAVWGVALILSLVWLFGCILNDVPEQEPAIQRCSRRVD